MKQKKYYGKSLQEVEALAVLELGVAFDDLYFDVISPEGTKDEEMEIEVIVDANPVKKGKDFLENFLKEANIYGFVERKMRDNVVEYSITTEDANGALIGYNSQTLNALQFITSLIVNQYFDRETESGLIVKVDVGDYRKSRDEKLEKLASKEKEILEEAKNKARDILLDAKEDANFIIKELENSSLTKDEIAKLEQELSEIVIELAKRK